MNFATTSLAVKNPAIHIITTEHDSVDIAVDDYITILDVNSTEIDSEYSRHTTCQNDFEHTDCYSTVIEYLTLVVKSTNITYELSSTDFIEECWGRNCAVIGKVSAVRGDIKWIEVKDYRVI